MTLLNTGQQLEVSEQRRLPVDNVGTDAITPVTGETVQLYFYNSGVYTIDAGQAAGVVVVGKLAYRNVKNALGDVTGTYNDTSLSFTSTALTTEVKFPNIIAERNDRLTGTVKAAAITEGFANGEYCVDYRTGAIYGVKADASVTLTSTAYKVETNTSGSGGGGIASDVNVAKVGGTAVTLGQKAMAASIPVVLPSDQTVGGADVDDSAFTAGTDQGQVVMGFYDTTDDEVDDGDKGALKMTAKRRLETRSEAYDSSTQSDRTAEVNPLNQQYVSETLIDETNITANTTTYAYIDMAGVKYVGIQGETSGAAPTDVLTVTFEASVQDDGTAAASCDYQDVTNALTGSASFVDTDFIGILDTVLPVKYLRVKYVTSAGGGNDADLTVYTKKLY